MKKIFKILVIIVLVLIIAVVAIPFVFKGKMVEMAKKEINNSVNANVNFGEFNLSIFKSFPNLAFSINDLSVIGTDTFDHDTLTYIKNMTVVVDLMSVMGDNIKVRSISLIHPVICAIVQKDGTTNWDIAPSDTADAVEEETSVETTSASSFNLALKNLQIKDAIIKYKDDEMGVSTTLNHLDLTLKGDMSLKETTLNFIAAIKEVGFSYEGVDYLTKANVEMDAKISANMEKSVYTFLDNKVTINDLPLTFDGNIAMPTDDISMNLSFAIKDSPFKQLLSLIPALYMNDFKDMKTSGSFSFNGVLKGVYNDNSMPGYNINLAINNGMFQYPDLPQAVKNVSMDLNVKNLDSADVNKTVVNLKQFHMEMAGNPFDAKLISKNLLVDPYIDAFVKGKIDLNTVKEIIPMDSVDINGLITANLSMKGNMSALDEERYEDFQADGNLDIQNMVYKMTDMPDTKIKDLKLTFSPAFVEMKNFDAKLGKSDIHAFGRIDNLLQYYFKDDTLTGKFNMSSGYFDINEWMTDDETETTADVIDTTSSDVGMSVVEIPKNVNFEMNSFITKMHYDNMDIGNFKGMLYIRGGELIMKDLSMQALDGILAMKGKYSTQDIAKPTISYEMTMTDIDIPKTYQSFKTVQEMAPILKNTTGKVTGKINMDMVLQQNMEPDMKKLNGFGNVQTKNIIIKGSKLFNMMDSFFGTKKFSEFKPKDTNLSIKIKDGNLSFDPFDFAIGKSIVHTEGKQSVEGALDYKMAWTVPKSEFGSQISSVMDAVSKKLKSQGINADVGENIDFNVLVGGMIDNADVKVVLGDQTGSMVDAVKEQVKEKIHEEIDKAKQKAIAEAKAKAAQLLSVAQTKANQVKAAAKQTADKMRSEGKNAADKIRSEANNQADNLIKQAGNNPLKKKLAQESAKKIRAEGERKAKQTENTANSKANDVENKTKQEADGLINTAKKQGDDLIRKAENR